MDLSINRPDSLLPRSAPLRGLALVAALLLVVGLWGVSAFNALVSLDQ